MRLLLCLGVWLAADGPAVPAPFELKPTDRLVLIGSTLVEREQTYGYWEAMLTARAPGLKVRNLGWSGDDVTGLARRAFDLDKPDIGRQRLVELTRAEKPTAIIICYGTNESFGGEAGLDQFKRGLEKLLDELRPTGARIALMSSPPLEDKGRPLPDPTAQNRRLAKYRDAIKQVADARSLYFADFFDAVGGTAEAMAGLTDNGLHLTEEGFKKTTPAFAKALGLPGDGTYSESLEPTRQAIRKKNELYFHRWRPQNQTYLFGFRKHEQGRNAKEIVEFDPLVAAAEGEIEKLLQR